MTSQGRTGLVTALIEVVACRLSSPCCSPSPNNPSLAKGNMVYGTLKIDQTTFPRVMPTDVPTLMASPIRNSMMATGTKESAESRSGRMNRNAGGR